MALLIEGAVPLFFPKQWRAAFNRIAAFPDGQIRCLGLLSLLAGLFLIGLFRLFS